MVSKATTGNLKRKYESNKTNAGAMREEVSFLRVGGVDKGDAMRRVA